MRQDIFGNKKILSVPQQISMTIKEAIYSGQLISGDPLPKQEDLAEKFGVSRPTIREAIQVLIDSQLIVAKKGRNGGYYVAEFSPNNVLANVHEMIMLSLASKTLTLADLFEVRKFIEIPSAKLAAERRTEEDLLRLEACLPRKEDIAEKNAQEILEIDLAFHVALVECTHNPLAITLIHAINSAYSKVPKKFNEEEKLHIIEDLPQLFLAIKHKEADEAGAIMSKHLGSYNEYYK